MSTSVGPNIDHDQTTSCEDFGRFARFNPYSVLEDVWMSFYYWGPTSPTWFVKFLLPNREQIAYLKYLIDDHVREPVNWTAPMVLLKEKSNITHLLVEQGDRGQYIVYTPYKDLSPGDTVDTVTVRIKQFDNGRYIGFMNCDMHVAYALVRLKDVPKKKLIQDEAAKMGFKGRKGKSYLYRGHEWMPIEEADYDNYIDNMDHSEEDY
ncbi:unnamed protein product [Pieris macdunnoughi]|nr:unnamed protein product [Pieris macdunnoughi]